MGNLTELRQEPRIGLLPSYSPPVPTQGRGDKPVQNPTRRSQVCHLGIKLPGTIQHFKVKFMTKGCIPSQLHQRQEPMTLELYAAALYTTGTACHCTACHCTVFHRHCMPLHCMPQALHATALYTTSIVYYCNICYKYTVCHYIV